MLAHMHPTPIRDIASRTPGWNFAFAALLVAGFALGSLVVERPTTELEALSAPCSPAPRLVEVEVTPGPEYTVVPVVREASDGRDPFTAPRHAASVDHP